MKNLTLASLMNFYKMFGVEINKVPNINSRHAVIYDRATRKYIIWKKRK